MRPWAPICLALVALPAPAAAEVRAWVVARPTSAAPTDPFATGPIQARAGEDVELAVVIRDDAGAIRGDVPAVRLDPRRAAVRPSAALPRGAEVRWLRVEPRLEHVDLPSPNPRFRVFSNNVLTGPQHGRWLGYDTLEYETHPLAGTGIVPRGAHVLVRGAHPRQRDRDRFGGAGSIWIAAEVHLPRAPGAPPEILRTADASDVDRLGLSPRVMRLGFRSSDDYLGWLSTYFQVPNLFGSNGRGGDHQSDRYVGADCADVLIGALRASGRRDVQYTSVSGIGRYADPVSDVLLLGADGVVRDPATRAALPLRWGSDVRPGDLMAIDYADDTTGELPRAWDHIGALVRDVPGGPPPGRGLLDAADLLRHMTHHGLDDQPLSAQTPIRLRLWRLRPRPR